MATWNSKVVAGGADWEEIWLPNMGPMITSKYGSGKQIQRNFLVDNADLEDFQNECFNSNAIIPGAHPGYSTLFVDSLNINPFGENFIDGGGYNVPEKWLIGVTYQQWIAQYQNAGSGPAPDVTNPEDIFLAEVGFTTEVMTIPGRSMVWESDAEEIKGEDVQAAKVIPISQWNLILPRIREIPWGPIRTNIGCVNKSKFWGAEPETVLFTGSQVSYRFSSDGTKIFDLSLAFTEKQIKFGVGAGLKVYGWNHVWGKHMGTGQYKWDRPLWGGKPLYTTVDTFNQMLVA